MSNDSSMHATTIVTVRKAGKVVIAGDGQVSLGQTIMKGNAKKVRRLGKGNVIAGFTGTQHRATYTCVGDTVNIAARIQDHTRVVDRPILIDQYTREGLPQDIHVESLGPMLFKGKQQPIHTFAVKPD